jgi:hypothetical protein
MNDIITKPQTIVESLKFELTPFCDTKYIDSLDLTDSDWLLIEKTLRSFATGSYNSIPMVCAGDKCVHSKICPFQTLRKAPLSKQCPFEWNMIIVWKEQYVKTLGIKDEDKVEQTMLQDLIESDIMISRANAILGDEGFIMENAVGVNENTGEVAYRKEVHAAVLIKEKAQARKDKLLKAFLATREAGLKGAKELDDISKKMAAIEGRVRNHTDNLKNKNATDGVITEEK